MERADGQPAEKAKRWATTVGGEVESYSAEQEG